PYKTIPYNIVFRQLPYSNTNISAILNNNDYKNDIENDNYQDLYEENDDYQNLFEENDQNSLEENNDHQNLFEENNQNSFEEKDKSNNYFSDKESIKLECSKFANNIKLNNTKSEVIVISDSESDITTYKKGKQQAYKYSIKPQKNE
ncbi:13904_t:CDS:2, partial [Racocetra fulgida]